MATNSKTNAKKINVTRNYKLFKLHCNENRPLDIKAHKSLVASMKQYGFIRCYPVIVRRDDKGAYIVKDGQHRLAIAETLGLPVYWIEDDVDFDVAVVNSAQSGWTPNDFARKWAANGIDSYIEGLKFATENKMPIIRAFALLAGTVEFRHIKRNFEQGKFKITDREWASKVASLYRSMVSISPKLRHSRFLEACMAASRAKNFDAGRLIHGADKCRDRIEIYSTRDAFLEMMEEMYNYRMRKLYPLKNEAIMAMRERSAIKVSPKKATADEHENTNGVSKTGNAYLTAKTYMAAKGK